MPITLTPTTPHHQLEAQPAAQTQRQEQLLREEVAQNNLGYDIEAQEPPRPENSTVVASRELGKEEKKKSKAPCVSATGCAWMGIGAAIAIVGLVIVVAVEVARK